MKLEDVAQHWNGLGEADPMWAILAEPDRKGQRWDADEFFLTGVVQIRTLMEQLNSIGATPQNSHALDFGCGMGRLTQALARYFESVSGVDIAPSMLELAEKHNHFGTKCKYYLNKSPDLSLFPNEQFDFICSFITLQHLEPKYSKVYLKEFARVLKPGGVAVFQVPAESKINENPARLFLKTHFPPVAWLYRRYRRMRHGDRWRVEMHVIPNEEVLQIMQQFGCPVLKSTQDECAKGYTSFTYIAKKL
jgi:ubiquinone/menaquinone biosynthesis C-methylase UbiE